MNFDIDKVFKTREWLGTNENPNHYGWATTPGYGNALRKIIEDILATK